MRYAISGAGPDRSSTRNFPRLYAAALALALLLAFLTGNATAQTIGTAALAGAAGVARPLITAPANGTVVEPADQAPLTFIWTPVPGAVLYAFEHTGPAQQFDNPNGTALDPANGFFGTGGGLLVAGTGFTTTLAPFTPPGYYQCRVIGLTAGGLVIGTFSDAVTVFVPNPAGRQGGPAVTRGGDEE